MEHYDSPVSGISVEEALVSFGLTRQESEVYRALLSEGTMNGYEIAKRVGVSRSNAYTSLASLVEKGAAWLADGSPARYVPVSPAEFCAGRIAALQRAGDVLIAALPDRKPDPGTFVTIRGRERSLDRLRAMIGDARERLYIAAPWRELRAMAGELAGREDIRLVILTDGDAIESGEVSLSLPRAEIHRVGEWTVELRAIADSSHVLTGDLSGPGEPTCLYSDQKNFADLFKNALRNEISLSRAGNGEANHGL